MGTETSEAQSEVTKKKIASVVEQLRQRAFGMAFWRFHALILGLALLLNGMWYSSQAVLFWQVSKDITRNPFLGQAEGEWVLTSFLGPMLGYFTGANRSLLAYCLLHFIVFLLGITLLVFLIRRQHSDFAARAVLIVLFTSPVANVVLTWLGSPDAFTVLLGLAIAAFWDRWIVVLLCSILLGIDHPEQGSIILLLLMLFSFIARGRGGAIRTGAIGMAGLLLGAAGVQTYFAARHFEVLYSRVEYILEQGPFEYVKSTFSQPFALLFSLFNALLFFLAAYVVQYWKRDKTARAFVVCSLLAFAVMLITLDQTRVFALLTFPVIVMLVCSRPLQATDGADRRFFETVLAISLVLGILIPRFTVRSGTVFFSAYPSIVNFLHNPQSLLLP